MPKASIQRCGTCRAEILFTVTERNAPHPVEITPTASGNLALALHGKQVHSHVVAAKLAFGRTDLHLSHFVGCPQSRMWRGRRRR